MQIASTRTVINKMLNVQRFLLISTKSNYSMIYTIIKNENTGYNCNFTVMHLHVLYYTIVVSASCGSGR